MNSQNNWVTEMRRETAHVEIFPIEVLRLLPACDDFDAGIYFLWKDEDLLYIGKSRQICNRLVMHEHARGTGQFWLKTPKQIPYDAHTCIIVESGRLPSPDLNDRLRPLERAYIAHYQPPYNYLGKNPGT